MTGVATCSGSTDISKMRLQANCACGEKRWHHVSITLVLDLSYLIISSARVFLYVNLGGEKNEGNRY